MEKMRNIIKRLDKLAPNRELYRERNLIVLSGDISDIDGFYALAMYAQLQTDVVFVMNYPAINGEHPLNLSSVEEYTTQVENSPNKQEAGRGYRYGTADLLRFTELKYYGDGDDSKTGYNAYYRLLKQFEASGLSGDAAYFHALTNLALFMARKIWEEVENEKKGRLYFTIGGTNDINPFHVAALKNELMVYTRAANRMGFKENSRSIARYVEGMVFDMYGRPALDPVKDLHYNAIYIDFSGSAAFFNRAWRDNLEERLKVVAACFVMGGVFSDREPTTMPAIKNSLNRFSCATMNQLYHPGRTGKLLSFLSKNNIPIFTVCNNTVPDLKLVVNRSIPDPNAWRTFLQANNLTGPCLHAFAEKYYTSVYNPPHKAFDYYTALALASHMQGNLRHRVNKRLMYNSTYGVTLVSPYDVIGSDALGQYQSNCDTRPMESDNAFIAVKKLNLDIEKQALPTLASNNTFVDVCDLSFDMDESTMSLSLLPPTAPANTTSSSFRSM